MPSMPIGPCVIALTINLDHLAPNKLAVFSVVAEQRSNSSSAQSLGVTSPLNSPGPNQVVVRVVLRTTVPGEIISPDNSTTQPIMRSTPTIGANHSSFRLFCIETNNPSDFR